MTVTGIIMECNPFHEGHAYIIEEARRMTGADYCIAAMSGDFVQRGEPAVFDKYVRAEQILRAGADLVLELPLYAACGSAEYFARGAVSLLDRLGVVTDLCFGSETGDTDHLLRCARILNLLESADRTADPEFEKKNSSPAPEKEAGRSESAPADENGKNSSPAPENRTAGEQSFDAQTARLYRICLQDGLRSGIPFPAARARALDLVRDQNSPASLPSTPNDLLAVEYCRALLAAGSPILPHAIRRIDVPSATSRRELLLADRSKMIPPAGQTGGEDRKILPAGQTDGEDRKIPPAGQTGGEDRKILPAGQTGGEDRKKNRSKVPCTFTALQMLSNNEYSGNSSLFPISPDDFSLQLLYALRMQEENLERFVDVSPDLAARIRNLLPGYRSFTQFRDLLKTKNVTRTRVSRALLHILLGMEKSRLARLASTGPCLYARPLAMRRNAAPLFSAIRKNTQLPFLSRLSAAGKLLLPQEFSFLKEEIRAEELYSLTWHAVDPASGPEPAPAAVQRRIIVL